MAEELRSDNQTHFGAEEPLFEPVWQPQPVVTEVAPTSPKNRKKLFLIGGVAVVIVLVLLTSLMALSDRSGPLLTETESTPPPSSQTLSPLDTKIKDLKTELKAADPSEQELPFPPVQMTIFLDELPR